MNDRIPRTPDNEGLPISQLDELAIEYLNGCQCERCKLKVHKEALIQIEFMSKKPGDYERYDKYFWDKVCGYTHNDL